MDTTPVDQLIDELRGRFENVGLYMTGASVQTPNPPDWTEVPEDTSVRDLISMGHDFMIHAQFRLGKVAWTKKVLDPDGYQQDIDFKIAAPTEQDLIIDQILGEDDE